MLVKFFEESHTSLFKLLQGDSSVETLNKKKIIELDTENIEQLELFDNSDNVNNETIPDDLFVSLIRVLASFVQIVNNQKIVSKVCFLCHGLLTKPTTKEKTKSILKVVVIIKQKWNKHLLDLQHPLRPLYDKCRNAIWNLLKNLEKGKGLNFHGDEELHVLAQEILS
eukprot:Pgem_evm1s20168